MNDQQTTDGPGVALIERERDEALQHVPLATLPTAREWQATIAVAQQIAATPFVPESYRGQPEAVVAAILTGREMGIGPMQAIRQIHMIDGRPAFAADLMLAKMRAGGIVIVDSEITDDRAWIHARRSDTGEEAEVEWTYADAEKITRKNKRLVDGDNWRNYRQDMLWARCVGRLARRLGSDLLGGLVYAAEEVRDFDDGEPDAGAYQQRTKTNPAGKLLPGAIDVKDADTAAAVRAAVARFDPALDWQTIETDAGEHAEGKPMKEWSAGQWGRHWRRLANAVVYVLDITGGSDLGPTPEQTDEAFLWAFGYQIPREPVPAATDGTESATDADPDVVDAETVPVATGPENAADEPGGAVDEASGTVASDADGGL